MSSHPTFWSTVTDRMIIFLAFSLSMLLSPKGSIWAARWPLTWYDLGRRREEEALSS